MFITLIHRIIKYVSNSKFHVLRTSMMCEYRVTIIIEPWNLELSTVHIQDVSPLFAYMNYLKLLMIKQIYFTCVILG